MGGNDQRGGPKKLLAAFGLGLVVGYFVCHFHICSYVGLCEATVVPHPGPVDPGPR